MPGGRKLRPVSARYDFYLFAALAVIFAFAGIMDATGHEAGWFTPFLLVCGTIALLAVAFVLANRRR